MAMTPQLVEVCRRLLNKAFIHGGAEFVTSLLAEFGMLCPICGARGLDDRNQVVTIGMGVEDGRDWVEARCNLCGNEWKTIVPNEPGPGVSDG